MFTFNVLVSSECPDRLLPHLSRAVYKHFLSTLTLTDFYAEQDATEICNNDEGNGSDDSDSIPNRQCMYLTKERLLF